MHRVSLLPGKKINGLKLHLLILHFHLVLHAYSRNLIVKFQVILTFQTNTHARTLKSLCKALTIFLSTIGLLTGTTFMHLIVVNGLNSGDT